MTLRNRPVISVAMATRNYGRYLPRALASVFRCHNPTGAPIQVVVADDASTDQTPAVLADFRRRFPESLEIVPLRTSAGVGAAKNAALGRCRGRIVALLDADDEFLPEKLTHASAAFERGGVDVVTSDFYNQGDGGPLWLRNRENWHSWFWPPSTWVLRRGLLRFNPHGPGAEDMEWMERRWWSLRRRHLDLPLNVQHFHAAQCSGRWESQTPGYQLSHRMVGSTHEHDRLAPHIWACRACGNQYLLPTHCCGREAIPRPLLFYWTALSPQCRSQVEFSVVLLTRNGLSFTRRAIASLLDRLSLAPGRTLELIVVDGGSSDGTLDYLRELAALLPLKLILTYPAEPFNYARACNRGARAAVGRYLLLLNNDIELQGEAPWPALRAALAQPRIGVVGAAAVRGTAGPEPDWPAAGPPYRVVERPVSGEFWGMRREVYWELGGMDEAFTGYGCDELDLQYRAQLAHYQRAQVRVAVAHAQHATYGTRYGPAALAAMEAANYWRFARKHGRAIRHRGERMEPFTGQEAPERTVVLAVRDEAAALRASLAAATADAACQAGRVQVVVVDNGSGDETGLVLGEYRGRLGNRLTVVRLGEPVGRRQAQEIGRARAAGATVRMPPPGDWEESPAGTGSSARPPRAAETRAEARLRDG
jgi:glycosyltransferase involved in cell wall biosynthesis